MSSPHQARSPQQDFLFRLNQILGHIELPQVQSFEALFESLDQSTLDPDQKIYILFFALCLKTPQELEYLQCFKIFTVPSSERKDVFLEIFHRFYKKFDHEVQMVFIPQGLTIVDVTQTLSYPITTGIQRVVKRLCLEWIREKKPVQFISFQNGYGCFTPVDTEYVLKIFSSEPPKKLRDPEPSFLEERMIRYRNLILDALVLLRALLLNKEFNPHAKNYFVKAIKKHGETLFKGRSKGEAFRAIFLWKNNFFLPETIPELANDRGLLFAKKASHSQFSMILYDFVPVFHPEYSSPGLPEAFVYYLRLLRVCDQVFAISRDIQREAEHFVSGFDPKPMCLAIPLSGSGLQGLESQASNESLPVILGVGTIEPRKNHLRVLHAAELLWKKGLKFKLVFVGHQGWKVESILKEFERIGQNYSFEWKKSLTDQELAQAYASCKFTVFCSHAEGYGLPVVESLLFHKPCIVSQVGCMKEFVDQGGCYPVQPHSIEEISEGMEKLLLNQGGAYQKLLEQIPQIKARTWLDYAQDVWAAITTKVSR